MDRYTPSDLSATNILQLSRLFSKSILFDILKFAYFMYRNITRQGERDVIVWSNLHNEQERQVV